MEQQLPRSSPVQESERQRNFHELQAILRQELEVTEKSATVTVHSFCHDYLDQQIQVILECAEMRSTYIQTFLYPIARQLDNQLVRLEIWASDIGIGSGTLEEPDSLDEHDSEDITRTLRLTKRTLLGIHKLSHNISKHLVNIFQIFYEDEEGISR